MDAITLYKFRSIDFFLIDTLVNGTIFCARPHCLNDPFDCQVDIRKAVDHAISLLTGRKKQNLEKLSKPNGLFDKIQNSIKKVGVCSFSFVLAEPLLWSHYANGHKGLCLHYEIPFEYFFEPTKKIEGAILPVDYGENPLTEWLIENAPEKKKINVSEFSNKLVERVLSIKGKEWNYEKEARIICIREGAFAIPRNCLKRVCFGMNTNESDIELIKQIIGNAGYSVEWYQIERTEKDFGIKPVKV